VTPLTLGFIGTSVDIGMTLKSGVFFFGRPAVSCERINSIAAKLIDDDVVYFKIMTLSISDNNDHHLHHFYDYMGEPAEDVGSDEIILTASKVVRWFKPITLVRQHEQRFCGPNALLNGADEKYVLQLGEVVTKFYLTDKAKLSDLVRDFNMNCREFKWMKVKTGSQYTTFDYIFDAIIDLNTSILVVAYMHNRDSNHCITIDCSLNTILDTDSKHPYPFHFDNKEDYMSMLHSYFSIDIHVSNVMCVYEGTTYNK